MHFRCVWFWYYLVYALVQVIGVCFDSDFLFLQERVKQRIQEIRKKDQMEREESFKIALQNPIQWRAASDDKEPSSPAVSTSAVPTSPDSVADLASSGVTPALAPIKVGSIEKAEKAANIKQLQFASGDMYKDGATPPLIPELCI